jgi:tRNA U55 pseudouridine synthase TruB
MRSASCLLPSATAVDLPASLRALRRTRIGPFAVEDATGPDEADPEDVRPAAELVRAAGLPEVTVDVATARRFAQGIPCAANERSRVALFADTLFVGLGEGDGERVHPKLILSASRNALEEADENGHSCD